MANAPFKKEERRSLNEQVYITNQNNSNEEELLDSFQSLETDEARLTEQKENLTALLNQLEIKAKEEVEKRKRKVERLTSEVADLKRRCEKFAAWINTQSALERSSPAL